jgi:HSF-type DNA-binding
MFNLLGCINGKVCLGRIIVYDRARVESEVLPKYFNHSSFASLRRQLNYFSFTRIGKGRQRGATYCNEGVVELNDVLRLKRRTTGNPVPRDLEGGSPLFSKALKKKQQHFPSTINSIVPFVHLPTTQRERQSSRSIEKLRAQKNEAKSVVVSPSNNSQTYICCGDDLKLHQAKASLDLEFKAECQLSSNIFRAEGYLHSQCCENDDRYIYGDDDVLAGCSALLSFASATTLVGKS